ncbi:cupin [Streptomyces sp. NPDC052071]|uniref:cupin n=1 Tax=unclassified Streptomyces TaxID=2593676 RepID=UPI0033B585F9
MPWWTSLYGSLRVSAVRKGDGAGGRRRRECSPRARTGRDHRHQSVAQGLQEGDDLRGHGGDVPGLFVDDSGDEPQEVRLRTSSGDYVFVPPFVPHREENPDPDEEAVVVIARSTQEAIVVNLPRLYALDPGAASD